VLSTDDPAIAEEGRRVGLEVPFMRPAELALDETPMLPVLKHAIAEVVREGWAPDYVVLLQPTSPLRRPYHIQEAVHRLITSRADSVVTVVEVPRHFSPDYVMRIEHDVLRPFLPEGAGVTRRQDARRAFSRDGTVYAFKRDTIEKYGDIYGDRCLPLIVNPAESLSIDSPEDWAEAERRLGVRSRGSSDPPQ
jgi:CMP-N-acetylneuraminic acid synthetase